jgi:hypothetical protein
LYCTLQTDIQSGSLTGVKTAILKLLIMRYRLQNLMLNKKSVVQRQSVPVIKVSLPAEEIRQDLYLPGWQTRNGHENHNYNKVKKGESDVA